MPAPNQPDTPLFSIGSAARILGISVHTMRMYERRGLIVPYKTETKQRRYSETDIDRLRCIRGAINVEKISIEGIRRVLSLIPCWAIVHCGETDRQECPAYNGHSEPCWATKCRAAFCRDRDCRSCEVYTNFADCQSLKERFKSLLPL
jgi:MerR family transcriptional regulator/heat shock protein HspR